MLNIHIKTIPHKKHRYPTVGDYWSEAGRDEIRVSALSDWRYEFLIALHEMIEFYLCKHRGISEESITEFDVLFERARALGLSWVADEPGFDPDAPYMKEHAFATKLERMMAHELGVDWETYERELERLP